MSSTASGSQTEQSSLGVRIFRDICEALAFARAKRREYFSKLFLAR